MSTKKPDVKGKILQTVVDLLIKETSIEDITTRRIAEKANVNSALINYYFQSKDQLINQAVEVCMGNFADKMKRDADQAGSPAERLRKMIIDLADFSYYTAYLSQYAVRNDLDQGSIHTGQILQPILKQIFPDKKDLELKILAMQIIIPIQVLFLNSENYNQYFYLQLENKTDRDKVINQVINNILNQTN